MNSAVEGLSSLLYGFGSALVPVLNAEAYVGVYAAVAPLSLLVVVVAVGVGQTLGKLVLFEGTRRGQDIVRKRTRSRPRRDGAVATRVRAWSGRLMRLLDDPRGGAVTVLASATAGVPPLAAVSVAAGASAQRRSVFVWCCLLGRIVRFAVLAVPLAYAMH